MLDFLLLSTIFAVVGSLGTYSLKILDWQASLAALGLSFLYIFLAGPPAWFQLAGFIVLAAAGSLLARSANVKRGNARGIGSVIANGGPAILLFMLAKVVGLDSSAPIVLCAALAAALSDTLASDLGRLTGRAVDILHPRTVVTAGTNGGISLIGQVAALAGSSCMAILGIILFDLSDLAALAVAGLGFLGCQIDSILGRTLERNELERDRPLGKHDVNFISGIVAGAIAFLV